WFRCWRSWSRCSTCIFRGGTGGRGSGSGRATSTGPACGSRAPRRAPPRPRCTTNPRRGCTCGSETSSGSTAWNTRGAPRSCVSPSPTRARGWPTSTPSGWCSARGDRLGGGWFWTPSRNGCSPRTSPATPPTSRVRPRRRAFPWSSFRGTASVTSSRSPGWRTRWRERATPATSGSRSRRPTGWATPTGVPSASTPTSGPTTRIPTGGRNRA
ncbi:MAG: hypothetical protein AVDCRST_MAG02-2620, partial [uncultured Rubrobacteraceae bacterium]